MSAKRRNLTIKWASSQEARNGQQSGSSFLLADVQKRFCTNFGLLSVLRNESERRSWRNLADMLLQCLFVIFVHQES